MILLEAHYICHSYRIALNFLGRNYKWNHENFIHEYLDIHEVRMNNRRTSRTEFKKSRKFEAIYGSKPS